ncbi:MAG: MATE family efflux transporter [Clostridiales bacterium]|nr:MATE family efflux transporter [Clostridiales bacterium]
MAKENPIQLSDHFTYGKLIRFTIPSIAMMIFSSVYGVVDGFFVSNFAGKTAFAAVNFIMPVLMIMGTFGFMFGTGGSALISKTMGEGDKPKANRIFSMLTYISLGTGIVLGLLGCLFLRPLAGLLGAEGELLENSIVYGRIILLALPAYMLQMEFQSFFVTSEKPQLGFWVTVGAGVTNMVLDGLFVAVFQWGLVGAAWATAISQMVGGFLPLVYFFRPNTSLLRLGKTVFDGRALLLTCTNGFSELLGNISMSLVAVLYNVQLMKFAGEDGLAAYGVLMYVSMIFFSAFMGYSVGTAPVIGFHFGAGNHDELKNLLKRSVIIIGTLSVCMFFTSELIARPMATFFVGYDTDLLELTVRGFRVYSFMFLFAGMGIYGSSFFTALNNGIVSAVISALRTLGFQVLAILLFPVFWGTDGIWISEVFAEAMTVVMVVICLVLFRKRYRYW